MKDYETVDNKMNEDNNVPNCKQRFKAIEGFFRRVAFNLGNSPSQTEVKIISCIPIDVTDLQQKIFQLQKELDERKNAETKEKAIAEKKEDPPNPITSPIQTAVCATCPKCSTKREQQTNAEVAYNDRFCHDSRISEFCHSADWPDTSSRYQRSTISFICPSGSSEKSPFYSETISIPINTQRHAKPSDSRRKLFSRKKKKCQPQIVYCAQTETKSPFCKTKDALSTQVTKDSDKRLHLGRSYLTDVARRQYKTIPVLNEKSNLSEISTPVCRDNIPQSSQTSYEADLCSCCHGQFQNIDNHINRQNKFQVYQTYETAENYKGNAYYDANLYDLVPVKENCLKIKNNMDIPKKKVTKPVATKFCSKEDYSKYRVTPARLVNYRTVSPMRNHYPKRVFLKPLDKRDLVLNSMAAKQVVRPIYAQRDNHSKFGCVDLGPVYKKPTLNNFKEETSTSVKIGNSLVTKNNNVDRLTSTVAVAENHCIDKTETTLNQIKDILQTVLTEVKTNSKLTKLPELPKKDAVVQYGSSQANIFAASQLIQSYTYSPYHMEPFIASCSHQMPSNSYAIPSMPSKFMQQYPLLIQPQKHVCTNCYRNTQVTSKHKSSSKHAASAATNTEQIQERSKETDKLIKEIYKSMALDIDIPSSKDNTVGNYTKLKSIEKDPINMFRVEKNKESSHTAAAISEIFKNTNPLDSSNTKYTDTTLESTQTSNEASVGSDRVMKNHYLTNKIYRYSQNDNSTSETIHRDKQADQMSHDHESEESDDTIVNKDTSASETDTDDAVVEDKVKKSTRLDETRTEKAGLFKKMLKIFIPRQRRKRNNDVANAIELETESDSDDYQTVYSQKVAIPKQKKVVSVRSRPHSKVFHSKQLQQRRSRTKSPEKSYGTSPYMEQEYRRYWNEKLMFNEYQNKKKHSTDTYRDTADVSRTRRPTYYQNYEARSALVEPIRQMPQRLSGNAPEPRYEDIKNSANNDRIYRNYSEKRPNNRDNHPNSPGNKLIYATHRPHMSEAHPANNDIDNNILYDNNNLRKAGVNSSVKPHFVTSKNGIRTKSAKGLSWLKKRKLGLSCGQQWKELILEG